MLHGFRDRSPIGGHVWREATSHNAGRAILANNDILRGLFVGHDRRLPNKLLGILVRNQLACDTGRASVSAADTEDGDLRHARDSISGQLLHVAG